MFIIFPLQIFYFTSKIALANFNSSWVINYNLLGAITCSEERYIEGKILKIESKKRDNKIIKYVINRPPYLGIHSLTYFTNTGGDQYITRQRV